MHSSSGSSERKPYAECTVLEVIESRLRGGATSILEIRAVEYYRHQVLSRLLIFIGLASHSLLFRLCQKLDMGNWVKAPFRPHSFGCLAGGIWLSASFHHCSMLDSLARKNVKFLGKYPVHTRNSGLQSEYLLLSEFSPYHIEGVVSHSYDIQVYPGHKSDRKCIRTILAYQGFVDDRDPLRECLLCWWIAATKTIYRGQQYVPATLMEETPGLVETSYFTLIRSTTIAFRSLGEQT